MGKSVRLAIGGAVLGMEVQTKIIPKDCINWEWVIVLVMALCHSSTFTFLAPPEHGHHVWAWRAETVSLCIPITLQHSIWHDPAVARMHRAEGIHRFVLVPVPSGHTLEPPGPVNSTPFCSTLWGPVVWG